MRRRQAWCAPSASCANLRQADVPVQGRCQQRRIVNTTQVNAFLREIAGIKISLKDFPYPDGLRRGAGIVVADFAGASARPQEAGAGAVRAAADELSNTPAICRKKLCT